MKITKDFRGLAQEELRLRLAELKKELLKDDLFLLGSLGGSRFEHLIGVE